MIRVFMDRIFLISSVFLENTKSMQQDPNLPMSEPAFFLPEPAAAVVSPSTPVPQKRKRSASVTKAEPTLSDPATESTDQPKAASKKPKAKKAKTEKSSEDASSDSEPRRKSSNVTLNTQYDLSTPGTAASKCPPLRDWLRHGPGARATVNKCIQKPRGVSQADWDKISLDGKALFVLHYQTCKDMHTLGKLSLEDFLAYVQDAEAHYAAKKINSDSRISAYEVRENIKLNRAAKRIEKDVRDRIIRCCDIENTVLKAAESETTTD